MKVFITNYQSPGDIVMLTAAVRDLKLSHPNIDIGIDTSAMGLWDNNPHIDHAMEKCDADIVIRAEYPLINTSNTSPYHFIHGFRKDLEQKLDLKITATDFNGDIHLSEEEKCWKSQIEEYGWSGKYWVIIAGGKYDFTAKWWNPNAYKSVVESMDGIIKFVQCGSAGHWHPKLAGTIDMIGKTDIRQFVRMIYHAEGVVCPVTFAMHLAASVPVKNEVPKNRPCVVIAGGREPAQWEAYPHHRYLSTNGALLCCDNGGCWKSRCQKVGDGDPKDSEDVCTSPINVGAVNIPKCMDMISPQMVTDAIMMYYKGGALETPSELMKKNKPQKTAKIRRAQSLNDSTFEPPKKLIVESDFEVAFSGLQRSGNHLAINWIISQFDGNKFFVNDINNNHKKSRYRSGLASSKLPSLNNKMPTLGEMSNSGSLDIIINSYENIFPSQVDFHSRVSSKRKLKVVILRDLPNWVASFHHMTKRNGREYKYFKNIDWLVRIWVKSALMFIDGAPDDTILISFIDFIKSESYMDDIASRIGVTLRSDKEMLSVPKYGFASSFDKMKYNGRGNEMKVGERWKKVKDEPWFIEFLNKNKPAIDLSNEVFGNIMEV